MVIEFVPVGTRLAIGWAASLPDNIPSGLPALMEQNMHVQLPACIFILRYQRIPDEATCGFLFGMGTTLVLYFSWQAC